MAELAEQSAQAKRVFFKKLIILNKKKIDSLCLFVRLFVAASRAICRGCCWKPCWLPKRPALRGLRGRIASAAPSIRCATRWSTARARPGAAHRAARPEQAAVCAGADGAQPGERRSVFSAQSSTTLQALAGAGAQRPRPRPGATRAAAAAARSPAGQPDRAPSGGGACSRPAAPAEPPRGRWSVRVRRFSCACPRPHGRRAHDGLR